VALTVRPRPTDPPAEPIDELPGWLLNRPSVDEILGRDRGPILWIEAALASVGIPVDAGRLRHGRTSWVNVAIMLAVPPFACVVWFLLWSRRNPSAARLAHVRRSRAASEALRDISVACGRPGGLAATVLGYLHNRAGVSRNAVTPTDVKTSLAGKAPDNLVERTVALLRACDAARFGLPTSSERDLAATAEALVLDWEAQS